MASRQALGIRPDAAACGTRGRKADRLRPAQQLRQALAIEHAEDKTAKFLLSPDRAFEHRHELLARHGEDLRIEPFLRGDRRLGKDWGSGRDDQGGVARHVKRAGQRDPIAKGVKNIGLCPFCGDLEGEDSEKRTRIPRRARK